MLMSARILGQHYGLTAEEMNRVLVKLGFLSGEPGDYEPTEKAKDYVVEKDYHRGTGGYSQYNRYWITRTYDESIMDDLNITPQLIDEVRDELAESRAARKKQSVYDSTGIPDLNETDVLDDYDGSTSEEYGTKILTFLLITGGTIVLGYGVYKVWPKLKKWWNNKKHKDDNQSKSA